MDKFKSQLENVVFHSITIVEDTNKHNYFLLLCSDHEKAELFWNLLNENLYMINISVGKSVIVSVRFIEKNEFVTAVMDLKETDNALKYVYENNIKYVSVGVQVQDGSFAHLSGITPFFEIDSH